MMGHSTLRHLVLACALALAALLAVAAASRSAELDPERPLTRIALGSCADQSRPQPIWAAVLDWQPELFLFLGDNVYGDVTSGEMTELRQAYARAARLPGYAGLRATVPHLAVWDDHDYGVNDGGAGFPFKRQAEALFLDFWAVPDGDPRRQRDGVYTAVTIGSAGKRVQVILLDTRFFRSPLQPTDAWGAPGKERYLPDPDPDKTMLGDAQWAWLEAELKAPADLRLIVSSIQVLPESHGWESWRNLPKERERLIELIGRTGANGVVFLSGDRHLGALYRRTEDVPYPLYELTSSSLNRPYLDADEPGPLRLGGVYGAENFGTVEIDWSAGEVTLALRGLDGSVVRRATVALADLAPSDLRPASGASGRTGSTSNRR